MNIFSESVMCWIPCATGIVLALVTLIWLLAPMRKVGNYRAKIGSGGAPADCEENDENPGESGNTAATSVSVPKVSVIIYSTTNEEQTMEYLESVTTQDYRNFEIILVLDSTYDNSAIFAEKCALRFPNVYVTFIPTGSHNLSRKKLALTLGMKAAKGEVVLTTVSNAHVPSETWLSEMMDPFIEDAGTQVVLGYTHLDYGEMHSIWRWRREFDDMLTNSQWTGYALQGKPYRGDGFNLAFKRQLFFEHKGYSKSIYLHSGDDDLFISEISTGNNTRVVLQPASILTTSWGKSTTRTWCERKEQYRFTSHWLRNSPFLKLGALSMMQWVVSLLLAASVACGIFKSCTSDMPDISAILLAVVAIIALFNFWIIEIVIYRRAAKTLGATRLWWAIPLFWLWQPINNVLFNLKHQSSTVKNFTWQR